MSWRFRPGQFMQAATAGDKPDWYEAPASVEKVLICRLSGQRASEECKHPVPAVLVLDSLDPTGIQLASFSPQEEVVPPPARPMRPGESPVFEDLFQVGSVPSELCPLHSVSVDSGSTSSSVTPIVDAAISPARPSGTPMAAASNPLVVERVLGSDGVMRVVMRQRQ